MHGKGSIEVLLDNFTKYMATNPPKGPGRIGAVREREQVYNPRNGRWTKVNTKNYLFMDQKFDDRPFKGIKKHK